MKYLIPCFIIFTSTLASAEEKPNVLIIFVDDQGYYDLGCYGATEFKTPCIDTLAKQGVRFTDYYAAAPICSPSRAGLLTGCYPKRVGLATWVQRADSDRGLHADELTLGELFQQNGYATACIGKWHLGFHEPFLPMNQGFDHYFGLLHNLDPVEVVYFEKAGGVPLMRGNNVVKRPADPNELTKLYTDEAITFIEQHKSKPFFVYLPHTMLHNPLGVGEKFRGSSNFGEYGDAIQELDFHVGRLMDKLKELKLDDNTIVVYASDNGRGPGRNESQPLRGRKLQTLEAGIRVPCIAWGPGLEIQSNTVNKDVTFAMDWYPTLASIAGIKIPKSHVIDGRDLSPLLKGKVKSVVELDGTSLNGRAINNRNWQPAGEWAELFRRDEYHNAFFYHGSEGQLAAVRFERWKLYLTPSLILYDLENDPGETKPARNGPIARKLRGMAVMFQEEMSRDARPFGSISEK